MSTAAGCRCLEPLSFEEGLAIEEGLDAACRCDPVSCGGAGVLNASPGLPLRAAVRALAMALRSGVVLRVPEQRVIRHADSPKDVDRRVLEALVAALAADGDVAGAAQAGVELADVVAAAGAVPVPACVDAFVSRSLGEQVLDLDRGGLAGAGCCGVSVDVADGPVRVCEVASEAAGRMWEVSLVLGGSEGPVLVGPVRVGEAVPTHGGGAVG